MNNTISIVSETETHLIYAELKNEWTSEFLSSN